MKATRYGDGHAPANTRADGAPRRVRPEDLAREIMCEASEAAWHEARADGTLGRTREQALAAHATDPESTNASMPGRVPEETDDSSPDPDDEASRSSREPQGFGARERAAAERMKARSRNLYLSKKGQ